jgi:LPS-assembly lipoprotein
MNDRTHIFRTHAGRAPADRTGAGRVPARSAVWLAALVTSLSLLGGCGFHLAGRAQLPPTLAAAWVDSPDIQSDFYHSLRAALKASGTSLRESSGAGVATIRVMKDGVSERVLTVSARNIPTAYELTYTVQVSVSLGGSELMAAETHSALREYSFDETAVLAKEREREALSAALADELVTRVMRRLASL